MKSKGFTLIELLVVVAILSILILVVAVSINVPKRLADANDVRRGSDIEKILSGVHQYIIDTKGTIPAGITSTEQQLGTSVAGCVNLNRGCNVTTNSCLDLSAVLVDYLPSIPFDPKNGSNSKTNYTISINSKNMVTVKACGAEGTSDISISM